MIWICIYEKRFDMLGQNYNLSWTTCHTLYSFSPVRVRRFALISYTISSNDILTKTQSRNQWSWRHNFRQCVRSGLLCACMCVPFYILQFRKAQWLPDNLCSFLLIHITIEASSFQVLHADTAQGAISRQGKLRKLTSLIVKNCFQKLLHDHDNKASPAS